MIAESALPLEKVKDVQVRGSLLSFYGAMNLMPSIGK
jgi:hypothetical protein